MKLSPNEEIKLWWLSFKADHIEPLDIFEQRKLLDLYDKKRKLDWDVYIV